MITPSFFLKLEPVPGSTISPCAQQAQRLADQLGVVVSFGFCGVTCLARPGGNVDKLLNEHHAATVQVTRTCIATS